MRAFMVDRGSLRQADSVICLLIFSAAPPCRARPQLATGRAGGRLINPWVKKTKGNSLIMNAKMAELVLKLHFLLLKLSLYLFTSGDLTGQERSEKELEKLKQQLEDPVLMPLPDTGADGPLDWAHLVDAAKAFEGSFYLTLVICGCQVYYLTAEVATSSL